MLGFAPLASATLGGAGTAREVILAGISGLSASVSLDTISLSTNAKISEQPLRKPETQHFHDPNNDGVGVLKNNEFPNYTWTNAFMLGMRPQQTNSNLPNYDDPNSAPEWDESINGDKALSVQTKATLEVSSNPLVSQSSWVPLVNGDYAYPATYDSSLGYDAVAKPVTVNLNHLPSETIVSNAATISTIDDPLLTTLTFPASDPTLFNVVVGQLRSINTYDPTNTDTYFNSLIDGQAGSFLNSLIGENKHYLLQKYDTDKGFDVGTLSVAASGNDKTDDTILVGLCNYRYIIPDSDSQVMTLEFNSAIKIPATQELTGFEVTQEDNLGIQANVSVDVTSFDIGTVGLPDPQWYLSTSRVELVAEPNQPANDVIYPYASRSPTAGPTQTDFDFTMSLGALDAPIAVDQPVDGLGLTFSLGTITLRSFNTLTVDSHLVTLSENLTGIEPQTTEIISSADTHITASLGSIVTLATSNAVCTTRLATLGLGNVTFAANANTAPSGEEVTQSENLSLTVTGDANVFPSGIEGVITVGSFGISAATLIPSVSGTLTLGDIGVAAKVFFPSYTLTASIGTLAATGIHFDFEAIKHLYNTNRSQHAGFPANRAVRPKFSTPRQVKPQNLVA